MPINLVEKSLTAAQNHSSYIVGSCEVKYMKQLFSTIPPARACSTLNVFPEKTNLKSVICILARLFLFFDKTKISTWLTFAAINHFLLSLLLSLTNNFLPPHFSRNPPTRQVFYYQISVSCRVSFSWCLNLCSSFSFDKK